MSHTSEPQNRDPADRDEHRLTLATSDERNMHDIHVRVARCSCGWEHMDAYRNGRRRRADRYLTGRHMDHIMEANNATNA